MCREKAMVRYVLKFENVESGESSGPYKSSSNMVFKNMAIFSSRYPLQLKQLEWAALM